MGMAPEGSPHLSYVNRSLYLQIHIQCTFFVAYYTILCCKHRFVLYKLACILCQQSIAVTILANHRGHLSTREQC